MNFPAACAFSNIAQWRATDAARTPQRSSRSAE
jgi:hypothetical protein